MFLLALIGCEPLSSVEVVDELACDPQDMAAGEVRARFVSCNDEVPSSGEGRKGDILLQSEVLHVVLRNPMESLTRPGFGGGSLVDATARGWRDRVLEAFPLVQDGFLDVEEVSLGTDEGSAWAVFSGPGVPLPPLGPGTADPVSIAWRLQRDRPVIELEGAEGLWLRPAEGALLLDAGYVLEGHAVLTDGRRVQDQAGALWLDDVTFVVVAAVDEALSLRWPEGVETDGGCAGDGVQVWQGEALLAVLGPDFQTRVPGDALLSCVAEGSEAGVATPPGLGLVLEPGAVGGLSVRVVDEQGGDLAALVSWSEGSAALPAGGGVAPIPPGNWSVSVDAGPAYDRWSGDVQVPEDLLGLTLRQAIDTEGRVLLELGRSAWPSWESGVSQAHDLELAGSQGRDLVIQTPEDEIAQPSTEGWAARHVRGLGGSLAETSSVGRVWSWPWTPNEKRAGHGAVAWQGRTAQDVLALAAGGAGERFTAVDVAWVAAAGEPWTWPTSPDLLYLEGLEDLPVLLDLLSHGTVIGVVGPLAWGLADNRSLPGLAALQRDLVTGAACATTGPLLTLETEVPEWQATGETLTLRLSARAAAEVTTLLLYVDGEVQAEQEVDPRETRAMLRWSGTVNRSAVGVAVGADWAVSAPILRTP